MSSVDDRIVNMQFNNKQFVSGASETQKSLEGLERTLANTAKSKGLEDMGRGVEGISAKFSALQVAGVSALATIASKATSAGLNLVKGLTIDPLLQGFQEYELNLKSIQTVMANTGLSVEKVGKYMDELNAYSDQTIYNFSQMAQNIGRFTAAGVDVRSATDAIKGMANAAALAGADTNQLNSAMYQMSQALSSGVIRLMDWNSLVNANMGGKNIQEALMATAKTMDDSGAAMEAAMEKSGNFRDSLAEGWLEADIYTKTMKVMAGQVNEAGDTVAFTTKQLEKMGYSSEAAKELNRLSAAAIESATKIKTFTQLIDVVKESIGSGFAKVFEGLFGNLEQAGALWTSVGTKITDSVGAVFDGVNNMLVSWRKAGGYEAMWSGFGNIFQTVGNLLRPFVALFQALFPATSDAGKGLANASKGFESVTNWLEVATRNTDILIPVFTKLGEAIRWVFGQLGTLISIGGRVTSVLGGLASSGIEIAEGIIGGILQGLDAGVILDAMVDLANNIVDSIKGALGINSPATELIPVGKNIILGIAQGISEGAQFIFQALKDLIPQLISAGGELVSSLAGSVMTGLPKLFSTIADAAANVAPAVGKALSAVGELAGQGLAAAGDKVVSVWNAVGAIFSALGSAISATFSALGDAVGWVADKFTGLFANNGENALGWASLINAVFSGALIITIRSFVKSFGGVMDDIRDILGSVSNAIGDFSGALKAQANAQLIKSIAIALGILALSLLALSFIDMEKLGKGLGAVASLLALVTATMFALTKIDADPTKIIALSASLVLLSFAILALSAAIAILGNLDMATLAKGLGAIAIGIGILVGAMLALDKIKGSISGMASSILILALAMNLLALAVFTLGNMDLTTLAKGLGAVAIGLGLLVGAMLAMDRIKGSVEGLAASILIMSVALVVMSAAVAAFGNMDMGTLAKGFGALAVGLGIMVAALLVLSGNSAGVLASAGAMVLMATAMNMLVGVILILGAAPWQVVAVGIGFVAAALAVLLGAAAVAMLVAPGLLALGVAVGLLGAAVALAGVGMLAFATGLTLLVAAGAAGIAVMSAAISAFIALLPSIAVQVAASFVTFIGVIAAAAPQIRESFSTIFREMIGVITDAIPEIRKLMSSLIKNAIGVVVDAAPEFEKLLEALMTVGLAVLRSSVPKWIQLGFMIIMSFLESARDQISGIVAVGAQLIAQFITAIGDNLPGIITAGIKTIIKFINGLATGIRENAGAIREAGLNLAGALIDGITGGLLSWGIDKVKDAAAALADAIPGPIKKVLGIESPSKVMMEFGRNIGEGLALGILNSIRLAVAAATQMANSVIAAGNAAVGGAQQKASAAQGQANKADAQADITEKRAKEAAKKAQQFAKNNKKNKAGIKKREQAAKELQRQADKQRKAATQAQTAADRADQKVADVQTFQNASPTERGDLKNERAQQLSDKANQMLAKANAEAAEARRLMKTNKKAGRAMLQQSRKTAKEARRLAAQALAENKKANSYYQQEANDRIGQLEDENAFEAADTTGQAEILQARAAANEARAKAARAESARLLAQAKAIAKKDAAAALRLVQKAEEAAAEAEEASSQAQQDRDEAARMLEPVNGPSSPDPGSGGSGSGGSSAPPPGVNILPSRSILEDAASTMDRYTASLQQASDLAAAQQGTIQFVQNNNSPEALSASEIYRQSKNLLSATEIKMAANSRINV